MTEKDLPTLRIRNVRLHQGGDTAKGTLSLEPYHLTFTYAQEDNKAATSVSHASPSLSAHSSSLSRTSVDTSDDRATKASSDGKPAERRHKPKSKTMWIAYPTINHCLLRPSHLRSQAARASISEESGVSFDAVDDAFPPSFGTGGYGRPSTDSAHLAPYSSPRRPASPVPDITNDDLLADSGRSPALRIRCRDFRMMAFHFHGSSSASKSPDEAARELFFALRSRCCVDKVEEMLAFHFRAPAEEKAAEPPAYDARREFARMNIGEKAPDSPGSAWRVTDINSDYGFSATYPSALCVPRAVSDNLLKYGAAFRSRSRIPALSYLHFNGGSITRSSQPMVGVQGKRNPQDERLVSAIFSSHTPPPASPADSPSQLPTASSASSFTLASNDSEAAQLDGDVPSLAVSQSETALDRQVPENARTVKPKVYGSTRCNLIVDARPRINAVANRATGGGIEDISNYAGTGDVPVEKIFLNIQNIHVMRSSLDKVIESFGNADYVGLPPDQELLRKSGWLGHISGVIDGAEQVVNRVGMSGSHALIHCSDGWDRTAQVSALAQVMLDPHYRTLTGFITLVQKDFLSFGHKFRDRTGTLGCEKWFEIENERIVPARGHDDGSSQSGPLNAFSSKALSGAKSWFDKNRGNLFRQQNASQDSLTEGTSRPASPPPNPLIHTTANGKDEKDHKTSEKEISPVFHQFLDSVYQLQRQFPHAFEFSERFLSRLLYQVYAGQYGEFLFNNERERLQYAGKVPSVWGHFLARRHEFINVKYDAKDQPGLLFPRRGPSESGSGQGPVEVRWWSNLFRRKDEEMNVPRALAPADPGPFNNQPSSLSLDDRAVTGAERGERPMTQASALRTAKSTPSLSTTKDDAMPRMSGLQMEQADDKIDDAVLVQKPAMQEQNGTQGTVAGYTDSAPAQSSGESEYVGTNEDTQKDTALPTRDDDDGGGDPLGVTKSQAQAYDSERLDFAAFAAHNAFRE